MQEPGKNEGEGGMAGTAEQWRGVSRLSVGVSRMKTDLKRDRNEAKVLPGCSEGSKEGAFPASLEALAHGAGTPWTSWPPLSKPRALKDGYLISYPREGVPAMSTKTSPPQRVSVRTRQRSVSCRQARSDGDRRHDQAAEPPTAGIESNTQSSPARCSPLHEFPLSKEDRWIDHIDALHFKVEQLKALVHAMHCVAYCEDEFFIMNKKAEDPASLEQVLPLSLLGQRLCDEVAAHVHAVYRHERVHAQDE